MSESHNPDNPDVVHEETDVNVRAILGFGLGLLVLAVIIHVFLWWLQGLYQRETDREQKRMYPLAVEERDLMPQTPALQANPQQDMRDLRQKQEGLLRGYGWVNRDGGIARIPIEEAMKILVDRGLPTRGATMQEMKK